MANAAVCMTIRKYADFAHLIFGYLHQFIYISMAKFTQLNKCTKNNFAKNKFLVF